MRRQIFVVSAMIVDANGSTSIVQITPSGKIITDA